MDNTRKKLIELLETVVSPKELLCAGEVLVSTSRVADHLIANGVTFATDNNVGDKMKKYKINNVGCDDETEGVFEFTEDQAAFLDKVFTELNEYSEYQCMPTIYIKCLEQEAKDG